MTNFEFSLSALTSMYILCIAKSFQSCASNLALDGLEDKNIVCLCKGQSCGKGLEMLETHASILFEVPVDPFTPDDFDVEDTR